MDVYACLLAFMLYIHVCLARSRFLLCFKPFVGLCLSVFGATCLCGCIHPSYGLFGCNHLWDTSPWCWFAWCIPLSAPCNVMLDLLALCPHLDLFVSLHLCTLAYMFMHESLCLLVLSSLIPTISCGFTLVLDTRDPESFIGILLGGTCVIILLSTPCDCSTTHHSDAFVPFISQSQCESIWIWRRCVVPWVCDWNLSRF